ncbi:MAG TPA: helix-turn-helix transcriptional regulator [Caulobacteraceae bacterium]|nr:helix-turn-helix transcriptional regulator [Caulobacteraceae bacterium]
MKITPILTDEAVLGEVARRVRRARLDRRMTQADLAEAAGVSRPTIERFEASGAGQLTTLARILRALDLLDRLDVLLPEATVRPIEAFETRGRGRQRASRGRKAAPPERKGAWTWGDQR